MQIQPPEAVKLAKEFLLSIRRTEPPGRRDTAYGR
jgi:hypothetical protein